jgi:hypothetical protein
MLPELPLSTLRLESEGSHSGLALAAVQGGDSSAAAAGGRDAMLLPLPGLGGDGVARPLSVTPEGPGGDDEACTSEEAAAAAEAASLSPGALRGRLLAAERQLRAWREGVAAASLKMSALEADVLRYHTLYEVTERDAKYLREVIVSAFTSGELPAHGNMFKVLSLMLHFTPEEVARMEAHAARSAGVLGGLGSLVSGLTSPLAAGPSTGGYGAKTQRRT